MRIRTIFGCTFLLLLLTAGGYAQEVTITIKVIAPPATPPQDTVLVIGNQPVWGNWLYPKGARMQKINDSTWIRKCSFNRNTPLELKITRGAYYKEALYNNNGQSPPAISFNAVKDTTIVIRPTAWNDIYQRCITGTVRYHHNFNSTFLKYTRDVTVWLPPSYFKSPAKKYPVLYAHDGQNIFDHTGGTGDEWHMDEVADSLMKKGAVEEFIIVVSFNTKGGCWNIPARLRVMIM